MPTDPKYLTRRASDHIVYDYYTPSTGTHVFSLRIPMSAFPVWDMPSLGRLIDSLCGHNLLEVEAERRPVPAPEIGPVTALIATVTYSFTPRPGYKEFLANLDRKIEAVLIAYLAPTVHTELLALLATMTDQEKSALLESLKKIGK
jgi:hypothetical protein